MQTHNYFLEHTSQQSLITKTEQLSISSVQSVYQQLHRTIDEMDVKIQDVIKKHEAQFLLAYQNHLKKIKTELAEIKNKTDQQQKLLTSNDRVNYLQRQLKLFRQQCMKVYDKLDIKTSENQTYRVRVKDLEKGQFVLQKQLRQISKKLKLCEAKNRSLQQKIFSLEQQIKSKESEIEKLTRDITNYQILGNTGFNLQPLHKMSLEETSKQKAPRTLGSPKRSLAKSYRSNSMFSGQQNYDSELKEWFLNCVRSVKKQIAQRKQYGGSVSAIDILRIGSIDDFRMIDKLRLLELLLENQKLLVWLYEKIFPDRMAEVKDYITPNQSKTRTKNQSKRQNLSKSQFATYQHRVQDVLDANNHPPSSLPRMNIIRQKKTAVRNKIAVNSGKLNLYIQGSN